MVFAFAGRLGDAAAIWSTLDADTLGEQPAAVFHGIRAAVDHGPRSRAVTTRLDTVVPRALAELVQVFDIPEGIEAFLAQTPAPPLLARIVARLRLRHLRA